MAGRALQITYLGDAKSVLAAQQQIDRGHTKLSGSTTSLGSRFKSVFGSLMPTAALAGAAGVGLAAKFIVDSATTEIEAQNQVNTIFGDSVDVINDFAETSARSAGISKGASLEAAGGFGAMLKSAGLAQDEAANLSVSIVQLAGDLASFKNVAPEEALEKLRSGLAGEAEPLRQFGVFLSEAAVQAEAYKSGIATVGDELTEAQKVQARYNIILEQTKDAQGDFGRTLGESLPNQIRALKAEVTDLAADFGQLLLPVLLEVAQVIGFLIDNVPELLTAFAAFAIIKFLPGLLTQVAGSLLAIGAVNTAATLQTVALGLASLGPAAGVAVLALGAVYLGLKILNHEDPTFAPALGAALADIAPKSEAFREGIDEATQDLGEMQQKAGLTQEGVVNLAGATESATGSAEDFARATKEEIHALRELALVTLAAENSFLGIRVAADDLSEAQREVNRLQQRGKEDTKAYDDAVFDALTQQLAFEEALIDYAQEADDAGVSTRDIARELRDAGRDAGLTKNDVNGLVREIIALINKGEEYDGQNFEATFTTRYVQVGKSTFQTGGSLQHGGIVDKPTIALIGEAGPEAVVPLSKAGGIGGRVGGPTIHLHIGTVVGPGGIEEVADILLREFQKHGIRNVTSGLV